MPGFWAEELPGKPLCPQQAFCPKKKKPKAGLGRKALKAPFLPKKAGCSAPGRNNPDRCRMPDRKRTDTRTAVITNKRFMVANDSYRGVRRSLSQDQPLTAPADTPPTMFLDRTR